MITNIVQDADALTYIDHPCIRRCLGLLRQQNTSKHTFKMTNRHEFIKYWFTSLWYKIHTERPSADTLRTIIRVSISLCTDELLEIYTPLAAMYMFNPDMLAASNADSTTCFHSPLYEILLFLLANTTTHSIHDNWTHTLYALSTITCTICTHQRRILYPLILRLISALDKSLYVNVTLNNIRRIATTANLL